MDKRSAGNRRVETQLYLRRHAGRVTSLLPLCCFPAGKPKFVRDPGNFTGGENDGEPQRKKPKIVEEMHIVKTHTGEQLSVGAVGFKPF